MTRRAGWAAGVLASGASVTWAMTQVGPTVAPTGDPALDLHRALLSADPTLWRHVGQVPASLRQHLATLPPNSVDLPMADRGAPYNTTDARTPGSPNARFVFGGRDETVGFVVYELGGFVPVQHLVVYSLRGDQILASCVYELRRWARGWGTLQRVLESGPGKVAGPCWPKRAPRSE